MLQENRLNIRHIRTPNSTLKLFAVYSPIPFKDLLCLNLYRELSLTDDEFTLDVLMAIKSNKNKFIYKLNKNYKNCPLAINLDALISQTHEFFNKLQQDLLTFKCYTGDILPFNCLWLDGDDSLVFFKVEKDDV